MRVLGLAMLLAACYSPSLAPGVPCPDGVCPGGQHCDRTVNPPACAPADARPSDAPPDAPPSCTTNADCATAAPFCDLTTSTCRGCQADTECDADICLEYLGQCANANNALFVSASGANTGTCTRQAPCMTLDFAQSQVANNRRIIAIADGTYAGHVNIQGNLNANSLTISGPDRDPAGVMLTGGLEIEGSPRENIIEGVTVRYSNGQRAVENRGTVTLSRVAIEATTVGLTSQNSGTLNVWDCKITGNLTHGVDISSTTTEILRTVITGNAGGGIEINNATTTIESSIISNNGSLASIFGGVRYQSLNGRPQVFRFNTLANNVASGGPPGVQCGGPVTLDSSIFVDGTDNNPLGPNCVPEYSLFAVSPPAGNGNVSGDPAFVAPGDYHIGPTSVARNNANPLTLVTRDIDGEVRPQGTARDIGADEVP